MEEVLFPPSYLKDRQHTRRYVARSDLAHAAPVSQRTALRAVTIAGPARERVDPDGARRSRERAESKRGHGRSENRNRRRVHGGCEMLRRRIVGHQHVAAPNQLRGSEQREDAGGAHGAGCTVPRDAGGGGTHLRG